MNKRDSHLLHELEHELEREDPTWVRRFAKAEPSSQTLNRLMLDTAFGLSVLIGAVGLLLRLSGVVALFGMVALAFGTFRFWR
jgi:hypothetical protein